MMLRLIEVPKELQEALVKEYREIKKRFALGDWGPGELKGGRFAEVILRIFQHLLGDSPTPFGDQISPSNKESILNRIKTDPNIDEHVRQKITSLTRLLLDFRNNRDSAHLGRFNANRMDAFFVMSVANWVMAELIRVFGDCPMEEAEAIVASITVKELPVIFEREGEQFIAKLGLSAKEEVLILLYRNEGGLDFDFLFSKTKDQNKTRFERTLDKMRKEKLIEVKDGKFFLMPRGIEAVEEKNLLSWK